MPKHNSSETIEKWVSFRENHHLENYLHWEISPVANLTKYKLVHFTSAILHSLMSAIEMTQNE